MQSQTADILIVDDNDDNRVLLKRRLERRGFKILTAENGREALDLIRQNRFDLILLDIMMPIMNGYQVLEELKVDPELHNIPVIIISGIDDIESVARCIELGAEDYLLKPFNKVLLNARINASLEKKKLRDKEKIYLQQIEDSNIQLERRIQEYTAELKMAQRVQMSLLPSELPIDDNWEYAVRWFPAREIAGDYYDFIIDRQGYTNLVIGDVTDKGLPASLFMVFARNSVRNSVSNLKKPAEIIKNANCLICTESNQGLFVSLVYAKINPTDGNIIYVNAGHPSPLLFRMDTQLLEEFPVTAMALGVNIDAAFEQCTVSLRPGDFIVFYTDGVIDALNEQGESFGIERLEKVIINYGQLSVDNLMETLETALRDFIGSNHWYDDVTIVITKKK
ncbi:MAG: fused response regulator/phosphatase [Chloroflexota bacterium]